MKGTASKSAYDYDIIVIGAGPGGYETAIKAAQCGKKTCIIEKEHFGGTCLNIGCIPTKVLIHTADMLNEIKKANEYAIGGIEPAKAAVDMARLQKRKEGVVKTLTTGVQALLRANKVAIENGVASFKDSHTITVGNKDITAENIIIATGSKVFMPPFIEVKNSKNVITSDDALSLARVPKSMCIIGGGVIGVEFAYFFNSIGAKVTVLELMDHILPMVDSEISNIAKKKMEKDGIEFKLGAKVKRVENGKVYYEFSGKEECADAESVLMAVGRVPNTDGLKAEEIGIEFNKKAIVADEKCRTNIANIYAIGDVNGKVMLAHTASHEGMVAVADICGHSESVDYEKIPSCIYVSPEISAIGLTEEAAKKAGKDIKIGRFPMAANGKSMICGATEGMVKAVIDAKTGEILGVHIYADRATEMIGEISVAITSELTAEEIIETIHPHPTVNEAVGEAFMSAWTGKAINSL